MNKSVTYSSYLKIDELIALQQPLSEPAEHDEQLFIIIHQVYELWFKLLVHEFEKARKDLFDCKLYPAIDTFKRARTVMKTLVSQLDVLETMSPMSFRSFRNRLESSSGFQSYQFRDLEFLLGYKREKMLAHHAEHPEAHARLKKRLAEPTVTNAFFHYIKTLDSSLPDVAIHASSESTQLNDDVQRVLLKIYKERPEIAILLEQFVDFDEGFQEWRYRHVKMVERTIGNVVGTGGSSGVEFLKATLFKPLFPNLWAIRDRL